MVSSPWLSKMDTAVSTRCFAGRINEKPSPLAANSCAGKLLMRTPIGNGKWFTVPLSMVSFCTCTRRSMLLASEM